MKQPKTLLDIGCGYGRLSSELLNSFPLLEPTGLDISQHYVDLYQKKVNRPAYLATIENFPENLGEFDCVLIVTVLMYVSPEKLKTSISKIWKHVKRGGVLIIIEPDISSHFFQNPFGIKDLLLKKGTKSIDINTAGHYFKHNEMLELFSNIEEVSSIKHYGMPILTSLIIPIYCFSKILPKKSLKYILNKILYLDLIIKKVSQPTLHSAYFIEKI